MLQLIHLFVLQINSGLRASERIKVSHSLSPFPFLFQHLIDASSNFCVFYMNLDTICIVGNLICLFVGGIREQNYIHEMQIGQIYCFVCVSFCFYIARFVESLF